MQLACCNCATDTPKAWLRLYMVLPAWTVYRIQPGGGPHGTTVCVGTGGTYNKVSGVRSDETRQFAWLRSSGVVLYWSANDASVSNGWTLVATQPEGGGQEEGGGGRVSLGVEDKEAVATTLGNALVAMGEMKIGRWVRVSVGLTAGM